MWRRPNAKHHRVELTAIKDTRTLKRSLSTYTTLEPEKRVVHMSTATELRPTSLAERIAKVRGRMLVATLTKVPPSNKDLFVALCRIYEQRDTERSSFSSESFDDLTPSLQEFVSVHETQEKARQQW